MARFAVLDFGSFQFKLLTASSQLQSPMIDERLCDRNLVGTYDWNQSEPLRDAIRAYLIAHRGLLENRQIVALLPTSYVYFRSLQFPFSKPKQLGSIIQMELDEELPLPPDELLIDYKPYLSTKSETHLLSVGLSRSVLTQFIEIFQAVDLDSPIVTFEGAVHGSIASAESTNGEVVAVLDIGARKSTFTAHVRNQLCFCRSFLFGGHQLTTALAEKYSLPYEKAELVKCRDLVLPSGSEPLRPEHQPLFSAIQPELDRLIQQLQFSLLHFETRTKLSLDRVILMGASSRLRNLTGYLSTRFKNVSFRKATDGNPPLIFDELLDWSQCYAAVQTVSGRHRSSLFNFRKGLVSYRKQLEAVRANLSKIAMVAAVVLIFPLAALLLNFILFKAEYQRLTRETVRVVRRELPDLNLKGVTSGSALLTEISNRRANTQKTLSAIKAVTNAPSAIDILNELSLSISPSLTIDINTLSITPEKVRMSAFTDSVETRDRIVERIRATPRFINVVAGPIENCTEGTCKDFSVEWEVARR